MSLIRTGSLAIALSLIGILSASAAPNTDFHSDTLTDLLSELRPPGSNDCPCPFSKMATWAGWTGPICEEEINVETVSVEVNSYDEYPTARASFVPFQNDGVCIAINDTPHRLVISKEISNGEQFFACLIDLDKLARDLGLFDGCDEFIPD